MVSAHGAALLLITSTSQPHAWFMSVDTQQALCVEAPSARRQHAAGTRCWRDVTAHLEHSSCIRPTATRSKVRNVNATTERYRSSVFYSAACCRQLNKKVCLWRGEGDGGCSHCQGILFQPPSGRYVVVLLSLHHAAFTHILEISRKNFLQSLKIPIYCEKKKL